MAVENYQWIPGRGPSAMSLTRMREQIKKPEEPMGEAWFISEKRLLYSEMMEEDPLKLSDRYLKDVLWEIASGTKCFGHLEEWDHWFQFLLPVLVEKSHEGFEFLEDTISAFFNLFDNGITEIYDGFRDDVISSLSLCLMKGELWYDWVDEVTKTAIQRPTFLVDCGVTRGWNCTKTRSEVSISTFFCLKYLRVEEIACWVKSLAAINDPFWQAHLLIWLVGFDDYMKQPPGTKQRIKKTSPSLRWHYDFLNEPASDERDFLPEVNVQTFLDDVRREINSEPLLRWIDSFSHKPALQEMLWNIPDIYFDKFISGD
jgi:hypothetical protein